MRRSRVPCWPLEARKKAGISRCVPGWICVSLAPCAICYGVRKYKAGSPGNWSDCNSNCVPRSTPAALADGGVLLPDLMNVLPEADWDTVLEDTFLEA